MWLKYDLPAGLSVFLVALPLCLGIALASGAPLYAGLLSGIIGGVVVALVSGSQLAVSGPAAGLTTLVAASIVSLGDYKIFLLAVIVAGLFQLILGILKLGVIANYFPSSVIKGMLAAIGIILISKQIPLALGYDQPDFWTNGFIKLFKLSTFRSNFINFDEHITKGSIAISIISLVVLILLQQLPYAKKLKIIPAPLVVVIVSVVANILLTKIDSGYALKRTQLVNIPGNILSNISFPDLSKIFSNIEIWKDGLSIGLLATLETLLCIEAIDKLDRRNRITPVNREMIAQGIGNITCGFLGAIPITAVVVRGAANVDAGARTKMSAFTHGLFLLIAVSFVPFLLNQIPYAALSAILIITGYNLARPKLFGNMWHLGWKQFLPFIITIVVILFTDLLVGVCIGLLISAYFIIQNNFKAEYKITTTVIDGVKTECIKLNSNVTFLNKVNLRKALDEVPENSVLIIDGSECNFIDYDILEIISEYENKARERHIQLQLKGIEKVNVLAVH
jgi:MFS superfamily sulfate permease-like transporter